MDKRQKNQRHKTLSPEELAELGPGRSASFDTEAGRAAQGMRSDLGKAAGPDDETAVPPPPVHTGNPPSDDKEDEDDVT